MSDLVIPCNWTARDYQKPLFQFMRDGGTRAVAIWHRRAGKDATSIQITKEQAFKRVGTYWHMLPTQTQGRRVVWDGITRDGSRALDAWNGWRTPGHPEGIVSHIRHDEMKIELINGSIWQVVGSDNYNALVGSNPVGVVFSEYSVADPAAWDYIRPILAENGGWALFIYTPRGRNHGYSMYQQARKNDAWFAQILTANDTGGIITEDAIQAERDAGMAEEMVQQEFYASFDASLVGAYYAKQLAIAREDGRIGRVPHDPNLRVHTVWDIGIGDSTAIGFVQAAGRERRFIDYYEASGEGLQHYIRVLNEKARARDWIYGHHFAPHDIEDREFGTGQSRLQTAAELGLEFSVVPKTNIELGIQAARSVFPLCWFDENKCARLIDGLASYIKEWDDKKKIFKDKPLHNWASHPADMFRYFAVGFYDEQHLEEDFEEPWEYEERSATTGY